MKGKTIKLIIIFIICVLSLFLIIDNRIFIMSKFIKSSITILDDAGNIIYKTNNKIKLSEDEDNIVKDNDVADSIINDVIQDIKSKFNYSDKKVIAYINTNNLIINSTINSEIQFKIDEVFNNNQSFTGNNLKLFNQASIVFMDYEGNVKGVRGGNNFDTSINRASRKLLKVGSTIKPVSIYSLGIEKDIINFSTIVEDIPQNTIYKGKTIVWPRNYNDIYESNVTVTDALKKSKNTVAVTLGSMIGEDEIFNFLKNSLNYSTIYESDISDDDKQLAALALGYFKDGITLDTLVSSYTMFGNEGYYEGKKYYKNVLDENNEIIIENEAVEKRVISYETASIMNRLLLNNIEDEDSIIKNMKGDKFEILGKTGTVADENNNVISNLFVGMTPEYLAGVWIGYDDSRPMIYGTYKSATDIWKSIFDKINGEHNKFDLSEGIVELEYCTKSGMLKSDKCEEAKIGYYKKNNIPNLCDINH